MSAKLRTTMKLLEHFVITTSDQARPGSHNNARVIIERREEQLQLPQSSQTLVLPSAGSPACLYCARPDNDSYYAASMTSNDNHSPRYQWCQWQSQNLRGIITNTINSLVLASSIIRTKPTYNNITTYNTSLVCHISSIGKIIYLKFSTLQNIIEFILQKLNPCECLHKVLSDQFPYRNSQKWLTFVQVDDTKMPPSILSARLILS